MKPKDTLSFSIEGSPQIRKALRDVAKRHKVSVSLVIRLCLDNYLGTIDRMLSNMRPAAGVQDRK
jgi:hypothetical protein